MTVTNPPPGPLALHFFDSPPLLHKTFFISLELGTVAESLTVHFDSATPSPLIEPQSWGWALLLSSRSNSFFSLIVIGILSHVLPHEPPPLPLMLFRISRARFRLVAPPPPWAALNSHQFHLFLFLIQSLIPRNLQDDVVNVTRMVERAYCKYYFSPTPPPTEFISNSTTTL